MKKNVILAMLALVVMTFPLVATAEIREGSFEVSPFIGYSFPAHDFNDNPVYGVRAGYNLTKNWGLEGAFEYIESTAELYHADVLYHFTPEQKFNPFLFAGIGGAHIRKGSNNEFMGNFGLGVKYSFTDTVALRADVRDVLTDFHSVIATVGLSFSFGGKTPKATPVAALPPQPEPKPEPKPEPQPEPKSEPRPEPKPEQAAPAPEPVKIILEDIHFDFDKATLTSVAKGILKNNVRTMKDNPGIRVQIEGHTCAHGSEAHNMALSERRANAVKEYLVNEGVSADRLSTIAYGETRLAMPEIPTPKNKESKEAKTNRRVHFEVIVK